MVEAFIKACPNEGGTISLWYCLLSTQTTIQQHRLSTSYLYESICSSMPNQIFEMDLWSITTWCHWKETQLFRSARVRSFLHWFATAALDSHCTRCLRFHVWSNTRAVRTGAHQRQLHGDGIQVPRPGLPEEVLHHQRDGGKGFMNSYKIDTHQCIFISYFYPFLKLFNFKIYSFSLLLELPSCSIPNIIPVCIVYTCMYVYTHVHSTPLHSTPSASSYLNRLNPLGRETLWSVLQELPSAMTFTSTIASLS